MTCIAISRIASILWELMWTDATTSRPFRLTPDCVIPFKWHANVNASPLSGSCKSYWLTDRLACRSFRFHYYLLIVVRTSFKMIAVIMKGWQIAICDATIKLRLCESRRGLEEMASESIIWVSHRIVSFKISRDSLVIRSFVFCNQSSNAELLSSLKIFFWIRRVIDWKFDRFVGKNRRENLRKTLDDVKSPAAHNYGRTEQTRNDKERMESKSNSPLKRKQRGVNDR